MICVQPSLFSASGRLSVAIACGVVGLARVHASDTAVGDVRTDDTEVAELFEAVASRADSNALRQALASGVDIDTRHPLRGGTLLSAACGNPDAWQCAYLLVEAGADVSIPDHGGRRAIHNAARSGSPEVLELLLEAGAEATGRLSNGETTLHLATLNPNARALVELLVTAGVPVNARSTGGATALVDAARWGKTSALSALLDFGADPNTTPTFGELEGLSPLMVAARYGSTGDVTTLIRNGALVTTVGPHGTTALMVAAEMRSASKVDALLQQVHPLESGRARHIRNCLRSRFDRVIVVATDERALEVVERQLGKAGLLIPSRVQIVLRDQDHDGLPAAA